MTVQEFCVLALDKARAAGIDPAEVFGVFSDGLRVKVFGGEIDDYSVRSAQGVSLRGLWGGRQGVAYTELLTPDAADELVAAVMDAASVVDSADEQPFAPGGQQYAAAEAFAPALADVTTDEKIALARRMETAAKGADPRVTQCDTCLCNYGASQTVLLSSLGLNLARRSNRLACYVSVVLSEGGRNYEGEDFCAGRALSDFDPEAMGRKAAALAAAKVGAAPAPTGAYDVVLDSQVVCDLLAAYMPAFSADREMRGMSCLKGRLSQKVASPLVTLIDDPLLPRSPASAGFDGEGTPTKKTALIQEGVLQTFLHHLKSAAKAGVSPTGHGARPSYKGGVSILPSNVILQPGRENLDELIARMGEGLYITSMSGMHAGLSQVTGDFSLLSSGFLVENGRKARPVERITLAGNFLTLLSSVAAVGCDTYEMPSTFHVYAPSVLVRGVSVAGA